MQPSRSPTRDREDLSLCSVLCNLRILAFDPLIDLIEHRQSEPFTNLHSVGFSVDRIVEEVVDIVRSIIVPCILQWNSLDVDDATTSRVINEKDCIKFSFLRTVEHLEQ